eukprot:GGOE01045338.1.p1 GENE.GGOE01045338.1~~GGOE01045338.1.p1  ORF type:complete len:338 (+),score=83.09 GGOE01045338.1:39-1016(+)
MSTDGEAEPLTAVRQSCRWVACQAISVRIDDDAVARFAAAFCPTPAAQQHPHEMSDVRQRVNWVCTVAQLAFGSGYRHLLQEHCGQGASQTMMNGTLAMAKRGHPFDAAALASVDLPFVSEMFGIGAPELKPLADKVVQSLTETSVMLQRLGFKDWNAFLADTLAERASCELLVSALVTHFPTFRDVSQYKGRPVHLYKKAQAMAALLHHHCGAEPGLPHLHFVDLPRLTILADNVVPAMMCADGVLVLSPVLKQRIERGELLPSGCKEEVELRACAVEAGERIVALATVQPLRCMDVDYALWRRGKEGRFRALERHATQDTAFY